MVRRAGGGVSEPSQAFGTAVRWVIDAEGGPTLVTDTGGLTRWGISSKAHPGVDIEHLTRKDAERIYRESYWEPIHGDSLPPMLAFAVFDAAVNMGVSKSVTILQTCLRRVGVDGVMGPETLAAAKLYLPRTELVAQCLELRLRQYGELAQKPAYTPYHYGWRMRVLRLALEVGGLRFA